MQILPLTLSCIPNIYSTLNFYVMKLITLDVVKINFKHKNYKNAKTNFISFIAAFWFF